MNVLLIPDSFKNSLSSEEVSLAMKSGIAELFPDVVVAHQSIADGGEGTFESLLSSNNGERKKEETCDSLFRKIYAEYVVLTNDVGVIEVAEASGVSLLSQRERNPMLTSSLGTGRQIVSVLNRGVKHLIVGLGGSATNDGGIGVLHALGYRFYDEDNNELEPIGSSLIKIASISEKNKVVDLTHVKIQLAVDVTNPLYGERGAAYVFGQQKGATVTMIKELDDGLRNFHKAASAFLGEELPQDTVGFGAAGGIAYGLVAFLGAEIVSGIDLISQQVGLEGKIKAADLVISGEGKVDKQSLDGKVISGIAKLTVKHNKPLVLLGGSVELTAEELNKAGVTAAFSIVNQPMSLEQAMSNKVTEQNLRFTASQVIGLFKK